MNLLKISLFCACAFPSILSAADSTKAQQALSENPTKMWSEIVSSELLPHVGILNQRNKDHPQQEAIDQLAKQVVLKDTHNISNTSLNNAFTNAKVILLPIFQQLKSDERSIKATVQATLIVNELDKNAHIPQKFPLNNPDLQKMVFHPNAENVLKTFKSLKDGHKAPIEAAMVMAIRFEELKQPLSLTELPLRNYSIFTMLSHPHFDSILAMAKKLKTQNESMEGEDVINTAIRVAPIDPDYPIERLPGSKTDPIHQLLNHPQKDALTPIYSKLRAQDKLTPENAYTTAEKMLKLQPSIPPKHFEYTKLKSILDHSDSKTAINALNSLYTDEVTFNEAVKITTNFLKITDDLSKKMNDNPSEFPILIKFLKDTSFDKISVKFLELSNANAPGTGIVDKILLSILSVHIPGGQIEKDPSVLKKIVGHKNPLSLIDHMDRSSKQGNFQFAQALEEALKARN